MDFKKNQEVVVTIDDLGNEGEGIGHLDGYALFVKEALPGETVRVKLMKCKKNYGFAKLLEILRDIPSADVGRVEPRCPIARPCGGCTLQHLAYERQLAYKERKVYHCLRRIGGVKFGDAVNTRFGVHSGEEDSNHETEICKKGERPACKKESCESQSDVEWLPILGMEAPWHYRNKAQFPVRTQKASDGTSRPVTGFYAGRTHSVIPITDCAIQDVRMKPILEIVLNWMSEQKIPAYDEQLHSGIVRHIYIRKGYHTGQIMVCLVINGTKIGHHLTDALLQKLSQIEGMASVFLNSNTEKTNVILGNKMSLLWGREYIEDRIGDIRYHISPQSFYQVNPVQTEKLYKTVLEFADLSGSEIVWDLYCGIGTISIYLAKHAQMVYGVEIVQEAVRNAKENATLNGVENVKFFCGAAEEIVPHLMVKDGKATGPIFQGDSLFDCGKEVRSEEQQVDVIVVDPPRKGCDRVLLDTMVQMAPSRIVYVSCDPATLARDVKVLGDYGYVVKKVRACDMFPQGGHVETVCVLGNKNRKPDDYLKVNIDVDKIHDILDKEKAEKEAKEKSQSE